MPDVVFMNKAVVTAFLMLLPPPYFVRIEYGLFLPFLRVSFEELLQLVKLALQGDANALGCKR